jgi:hypothetical protein
MIKFQVVQAGGRSPSFRVHVFLHSWVENDRGVSKVFPRREKALSPFDDAMFLVRTLDNHSNISFTHVPLGQIGLYFRSCAIDSRADDFSFVHTFVTKGV